MSLFDKLRGALSKTSGKIADGINHIFYKKKLDEETLEQLEELLLSSDIGPKTSQEVVAKIRQTKFDKDEVSEELIKQALSEIMIDILSHNDTKFTITDNKLNIVLVCGVNGNGKTTTIGKLAHLYAAQGKKVMIAACDTFRAAAREQLETWGRRSGCKVISGSEKQDPASLAYQAATKAINEKADLLFIDTAGRLQTQANLMTELSKVIKVIKKIDDSAPHHTLLVIDATTGQNALSQVAHFLEAANITGLVITKLDGTAKAGVVISLASQFKIPVYFIGIGEQIEDLREFNASEFAKNIVGL